MKPLLKSEKKIGQFPFKLNLYYPAAHLKNYITKERDVIKEHGI